MIKWVPYLKIKCVKICLKVSQNCKILSTKNSSFELLKKKFLNLKLLINFSFLFLVFLFTKPEVHMFFFWTKMNAMNDIERIFSFFFVHLRSKKEHVNFQYSISIFILRLFLIWKFFNWKKSKIENFLDLRIILKSSAINSVCLKKKKSFTKLFYGF